MVVGLWWVQLWLGVRQVVALGMLRVYRWGGFRWGTAARCSRSGWAGWVGRGVCGGGSICVNDVLQCCTSECVVVEEKALWEVLGEDDSAPGGDVLTRWGSVSNRPELAAEFHFLLFRCWAG